ncbi:MAG: hypothetical protein U0271_30025 [Polyangiaceae bacterium]
MDDPNDTGVRAALAPGQEAALQAIFAVDPKTARAFRLMAIRVEQFVVRAAYSNLQTGERVVLELAAGGPPRVRGAQSRAALQLAQHVTERAASLDALRWYPVRPRPVGRPEKGLNVELTAVLKGVKPALRTSVAARDAARTCAELGAAGLAVRVLERPVQMDGLEWTVVVASTDQGKSDRLLELEASSRSRESEEVHRELGRLLGYPPCCVDAFCGRLQYGGEAPDPIYRATRDAWTAEPHSRLNPLLFGEGTWLVSFEVCSFSCPTAIATADALASCADGPTLLAALDAALATPIAVHPNGARMKLRLERSGAVARIAAATPVPRFRSEQLERSHAELAATLVNREVDERGYVVGLDGVLVVDFGVGLSRCSTA